MKKPITRITGLTLMALTITSLTLVNKKVESIKVTSEKYLDVSGFDHMEVEVQNHFTFSQESVNWSLFGDIPVAQVHWGLTAESKGHISYVIKDMEMDGRVMVNLTKNEIELKLQIRSYGLVHWILSIDEVNPKFNNNYRER